MKSKVNKIKMGGVILLICSSCSTEHEEENDREVKNDSISNTITVMADTTWDVYTATDYTDSILTADTLSLSSDTIVSEQDAEDAASRSLFKLKKKR